MLQRPIRLFKLFGFQVNIDASWFILAILIVWSLATGLFPAYFHGLSAATYWWMGVVGALGLFFSIVFHEMWHSLVARKYGLPMRGITLFIFGGVSEMTEEPESAKVEFLMAIAGPLSSVVLTGVFYLIYVAARRLAWPVSVTGVVAYLAWINGLLAVFNMLPAFPLDGGRVLRAILWRAKQNLRWATRVAAGIGSAFGIALIILGVLSVVTGNLIGGIWWFLIGLFLYNASRTSYRQLVVRKVFEGEIVEHFMKPDPVTVDPSVPIDRLVDDYFYKYHHKMFPVTDGSHLAGCATVAQVKQIPREEWSRHTAGELAAECSPDNTVHPDDDAMKALSLMSRTGNSRLMVVQDDHLVGVITLRDMMKFLSIKIDFEGEDSERIRGD